MNILFVGDIHNHSYMFDDIKKLDEQYNFDRIICLGDYVDDWLTDNHQSLETLNKLIELKKSNPMKYTFLVGNHENSYLGFPCSGHQYVLDDIMERILTENIELFDLYTSVNIDNKEFICTHSGICNDFVTNQLIANEKTWKQALIDMNNNKLQSLPILNLCSYLRGGSNEYSSFIWTDKREHLYNNMVKPPIIPYQIMGHTPVKEITYDKDDLHTFIFIDTHSTYRDGSEYGNKSYLIWNENQFKQVLHKEL